MFQTESQLPTQVILRRLHIYSRKTYWSILKSGKTTDQLEQNMRARPSAITARQMQEADHLLLSHALTSILCPCFHSFPCANIRTKWIFLHGADAQCSALLDKGWKQFAQISGSLLHSKLSTDMQLHSALQQWTAQCFATMDFKFRHGVSFTRENKHSSLL